MAQKFFTSLTTALLALGTKRLVALGLIGISLFGVIFFSSLYLTRPTNETLYIGLTRDDVNKIGLALGDAGLRFDVAANGTAVSVPVGSAEKARMLLAEKGLPTSSNAGYELFDNMGSLGLTSFMQQVTRQRALEGEIVRTLQAVQGVKAARVHIVLPDKSYFRKEDQTPSASVVIRTDTSFSEESAQSIRHLVASAVPSLKVSAVTIMDTSGKLLASGADTANGSPVFMTNLQKQVSNFIEANIRRQLAPVVGLNHFQTSVNVTLNTDARSTNETVYDPDSKVERSVHAVKDSADNENSKKTNAVSVEQNIPQEETGVNAGGDVNSETHNRTEQTLNYEINSKVISTIRNGYSIDKLDVAVVIDKNLLIGEDKKSNNEKIQKEVDSRLAEIKKMIIAAAGIDIKRGDLLNVEAIDFISDKSDNMQPIEKPFLDIIAPYMTTIITFAALIIAVILIMFLGVRPLVREIKNSIEAANETSQTMDDLPGIQALSAAREAHLEGQKLEELALKMRTPPERRLERLVDLDEERFANILRDWTRRNPASSARVN